MFFTVLNSCFTIQKLPLSETCTAVIKCVGLDFIFLGSWIIDIEVMHTATYQNSSVLYCCI